MSYRYTGLYCFDGIFSSILIKAGFDIILQIHFINAMLCLLEVHAQEISSNIYSNCLIYSHLFVYISYIANHRVMFQMIIGHVKLHLPSLICIINGAVNIKQKAQELNHTHRQKGFECICSILTIFL